MPQEANDTYGDIPDKVKERQAASPPKGYRTIQSNDGFSELVSYLRSPMTGTHYISVILPLKLEWEPCYALPEGTDADMVEVGDRVKVMFANREYSGVISGKGITPDTDPGKIRTILHIEKDMERIFPQEIELWRKVADYYLCTVGEVYKAAYPYGKINLEEARAAAKSKVRERREKLIESIRIKIARLETRLEKKKELLAKARKESVKEGYAEDITRIETEIGRARKALEDAGRTGISGTADDTCIDVPGIMLSDAQNKAYSAIQAGFNAKKPVLLHGVTGSGKTEIYIKLALEVLSSHRNVLYLVPEIALSRQLEDRLYGYFGDRLLIFHSAESAASKRNVAEKIRASKEGCIVLGTRSSLFLPHHDLGLIIVDEEHDNSYKQDSPAPRYNGRDTALMLHQIHGCDIVLGTATPSLEELYNCQTGRHVLVRLKERFHGSGSSDMEIIDTRAERKKRGMTGNFSRKLIDHMNRTLADGGQIMILRSRRAWAPVMQCESCGEIVKCPHCNVSLSYHKDGRMVCHYCGYVEKHTGICRRCEGALTNLGAGTQRIEEEAAALFPAARIARLDSDSAQNKSFETRVIKEFAKGEIDILIGTQIVAKGFDFSNLSLVAVIAADALLGMQDFRADEKAIQLLEQFRGRCGRRDRKGLFVIQTSQPDHPVYKKIAADATDGIDIGLMQERKDFGFPPFSRMIEITVRDCSEDRAETMSHKLVSELKRIFAHSYGTPVTGPYSPVVSRIADRHIRTIRISLKKDRNLAKDKKAIKEAVQNIEKTLRYEGHIIMNVDPS